MTHLETGRSTWQSVLFQEMDGGKNEGWVLSLRVKVSGTKFENISNDYRVYAVTRKKERVWVYFLLRLPTVPCSKKLHDSGWERNVRVAYPNHSMEQYLPSYVNISNTYEVRHFPQFTHSHPNFKTHFNYYRSCDHSMERPQDADGRRLPDMEGGF